MFPVRRKQRPRTGKVTNRFLAFCFRPGPYQTVPVAWFLFLSLCVRTAPLADPTSLTDIASSFFPPRLLRSSSAPSAADRFLRVGDWRAEGGDGADLADG